MGIRGGNSRIWCTNTVKMGGRVVVGWRVSVGVASGDVRKYEVQGWKLSDQLTT